MNLQVEYKDSAGQINHQSHLMICLTFVKHLAISGQEIHQMYKNLFVQLGCFSIITTTYRVHLLIMTISVSRKFSYLTQQEKANF
ncbi:hypothetical protein EZS27_015723 [termite gut metagenome]|uniref:Uncharacterized protein n=1 Tax=termite gut metagenome TaxID=433724 RepID=A0A5J4RQ97_9ZZZZ